MTCLLFYECEANYYQLKGDIKIGCANAYVREYGKTGDISLFISEDMNGTVSGSDEIDDYSGALPVEEQEENDDEYISPIKELTYDEVTEPIEKNVASYDLSEMDWAEYLTHFTYLVEGLKDYRDELSKKHSDIDQKICDILHYIELCETDEMKPLIWLNC